MRWTCQCPSEHDGAVPVCATCLAHRPAPLRRREAEEPGQRSAAVEGRCSDCGEVVGWNRLTTGEDFRDRCASCHVRHLKARAERDTEAGTIQADRDRFRAILASEPWLRRFRSQR